MSHHACAQHHSVACYPAGRDRSQKVWDTNLCFLDAAQLQDHHTAFMLVKDFTAFFTYFLILRGKQQRLGYKLPYSCSFKWRIFLSV